MLELSPCVYCQERHPLCHAECKEYIRWLGADRERKAIIKAAKHKDSDYDRFKVQTVTATKKAISRR